MLCHVVEVPRWKPANEDENLLLCVCVNKKVFNEIYPFSSSKGTNSSAACTSSACPAIMLVASGADQMWEGLWTWQSEHITFISGRGYLANINKSNIVGRCSRLGIVLESGTNIKPSKIWTAQTTTNYILSQFGNLETCSLQGSSKGVPSALGMTTVTDFPLRCIFQSCSAKRENRPIVSILSG